MKITNEIRELRKIKRKKIDLSHLGKTIKVLMKMNGISGLEMSSRTGLSNEHISRIINGKTNPEIVTLAMLCEELNCSISITFDIKTINNKKEIYNGTREAELFGTGGKRTPR